MKNRLLLAGFAPALILALGACGDRAGDYERGVRDADQIRVNADRDPVIVTSKPATVEATVTIPASPTVVYVEPKTYSERVYYVDPSDNETVYYYSGGAPTTVVSRRIQRVGDRPYYVEYDGTTERRVYFDSSAASRAEIREAIRDRERLEKAARENDQRERDAWERRWRDARDRR